MAGLHLSRAKGGLERRHDNARLKLGDYPEALYRAAFSYKHHLVRSSASQFLRPLLTSRFGMAALPFQVQGEITPAPGKSTRLHGTIA